MFGVFAWWRPVSGGESCFLWSVSDAAVMESLWRTRAGKKQNCVWVTGCFDVSTDASEQRGCRGVHLSRLMTGRLSWRPKLQNNSGDLELKARRRRPRGRRTVEQEMEQSHQTESLHMARRLRRRLLMLKLNHSSVVSLRQNGLL